MEINRFTGISLGNQDMHSNTWARICGLGLEQLMAAGQLLVQTHTKTQTYWQWCSWSCPSQSRCRYSPRSCCPWVSHRFLPQCRTAGWSYRSTFPLLQAEDNGKGVCFIKRKREMMQKMWTQFTRKQYTHKLTFRFAFTLDASDSMAGTDQSAAQVRPFPLVINAVEVTILHTTIWQEEKNSWWDFGTS